jgi:hypothetical protein
LRDNPAFQPDIVPLLDDRTQGVRLRAAAGYLRLETVKNAPKPRNRQIKRTAVKPPA